MKKAAKVYFLGDSICVGFGVPIHKSWTSRLSRQLEKIGSRLKTEIQVANASVNGNTSRQALERMHFDVLSHTPDVVLVQFGMNDCNYWESDKGCPRVSEKAFKWNLVEIIERCHSHGVKKVLLNTNHPSGRLGPISSSIRVDYQQSNRKYNAIVRSVAARFKKRVVLIDMERRFWDHIGKNKTKLAELLLPDNIHLSVKGHDVYMNAVGPVLCSLVEQVIRREE